MGKRPRKSIIQQNRLVGLWVYGLMGLLVFSASAQVEDEDDSARDLDEKVEGLSAEVESLAASVEAQTEELSRIRIWGETKLRLKNTTHSDVSYATGPYGETLEKGQKLNHRMILEMEARITEKLAAGGMVRLSNEDKIVFETGPERLSSDRGSVFIKYNPRNLRWTFGYYDIHFTPLTLMRWDMEDNPEGAGRSGCACPSEGGAITSESLEELGPDLMFEGGKIAAGIGGYMDVVALLARPRMAEEGKTYRQYLYGTNVKFLSYHKPSTSFRWLGITAISIDDDETSIIQPSRISYDPIRNKVYSVDFNLPVREILLLKGELALSSLRSEEDETSRGRAAILGMSIKYPHGMLTKVSYLRMNPKYGSFYNALSYTSNRHGFRISSNYDIVKDKSSIWVFYKRLRELESLIKSEPELVKTFSTVSFGTSIAPIEDLLIRASYILKLTRRDKGVDLGEVHRVTQSINMEFTYNLARESSLTIRYQYIDYRDKFDKKSDYHANITSILVSTRF